MSGRGITSRKHERRLGRRGFPPPVSEDRGGAGAVAAVNGMVLFRQHGDRHRRRRVT